MPTDMPGADAQELTEVPTEAREAAYDAIAAYPDCSATNTPCAECAAKLAVEAAAPFLIEAGKAAGRAQAAADTQEVLKLQTAEAILTAHQRHRGGCLCGWSELGKSHPRHQVAMLREAATLQHPNREIGN